jgi:hypothetical protein
MCVDLASSREEINVNMMRYCMPNKPLVFFHVFSPCFCLFSFIFFVLFLYLDFFGCFLKLFVGFVT